MSSHALIMPTEDEDFDAVSGPLKPRKPRSPNKNANNAKLTALPVDLTVPKTVTSAAVLDELSNELSIVDAQISPAEAVDVDVKSTPITQALHEPEAVLPQTVHEPEVQEPASNHDFESAVISDENDTLPAVSQSVPKQIEQSQNEATDITHELYIPEHNDIDDDDDLFADYVPTDAKQYDKPAKITSARQLFAHEPEFVSPRQAIVEPAAPSSPITVPIQDTLPEVSADHVSSQVQFQPAAASDPIKQTKQRNFRAPSMPSISLPQMPRIAGKRLAFEAALVLAVLGLVGVVNKTNHQKQQVQADLSSLRANPEVALQQQTDNLIKTVGQLVTLPSGETPTVANVSDAEQAKQQSPFFANSQNGDKVLMYVKAKQAILYRPATDNIILVAPLTFNNSAQTQAASGTTTLPTTKTAGSTLKP